MRKAYEPQLSLGQASIPNVDLDLDSRHELVLILAGLQHLYSRPGVRDSILQQVEQDVVGEHQPDWGAPGMSYWEVLVLGAVRQGCNLDYDALHDLANNHRTLRQIMGLDPWEGSRWGYTTIYDNVSQLSTDTLKWISNQIVTEGHRLAPAAIEAVRGDGTVTETNIHYPTDANLMVDGLRVMLRLVARLCDLTGVTGWRQRKYLFKQGKRLLRKIQKAKALERRRELYEELIAHVRTIGARVLATIDEVREQAGPSGMAQAVEVQRVIDELSDFQTKTDSVCSLAERRVLWGETIPNAEKIFSLFESHTELINRGKSPNPIEFGRRIVVLEDRVGFILECRVLDRGQQEQTVLIPMMKEVQERAKYQIRSASFDRGFYTPANREELQKLVGLACLPKKGHVRGAALAAESTVEFRAARRRHAGIESAIHGLKSGGGLDRCRDRTEAGYTRYVALAVLGRNLQTLGRLVLEQRRRERQAA